MNCDRIVFSGHAVRQMFQRGLSRDDVIIVIREGKVIVDYPDDTPYPSSIILGFVRNTPVHVVMALDEKNRTGIVITAYIPDKKLWSDDFKTRRR